MHTNGFATLPDELLARPGCDAARDFKQWEPGAR